MDIAFYTVGDTRSPDAQPLVDSRRRARNAMPVPFGSVSEMYREYANRLVGSDNVFGVNDSAGAASAVTRHLADRSGQTLRHLYCIGHGNQVFVWRVRAEGNVLVESLAPLYSPVRFARGQWVLDRNEHYRFFAAVSRAMGEQRQRHIVQFRACFLEQRTVDGYAAAIGLALRDGGRQESERQVEVSGYRGFYAVVAGSDGRFRSEILSRDTDAVVGRSIGVGAPPAEIFACSRGGAVHQSARCPRD